MQRWTDDDPTITLVLLVVAVPVMAGVVMSLVGLVTTPVPYLGWSQTVASDAKAVALGASLYGDPAEGYTGMLYGPLFPTLLAPLYRLVWWDGWPALATILSALTLAGLVGVIAATGATDRRPIRIATGVGMAGMAWWVVSSNPVDVLYDGRSDHFAWMLALGGLCALAWAVDRHRGVWPAVLLLSGALWTKQTTAGAMGAAAAVMTWWAWTGVVTWAVWRRLVGGLVALNLAVLVALLVATDGWAWFFLVTLPGRHATDPAVATYIGEAAAILWLPALVALTVAPFARGWLRPKSLSGLLGVLLVAFLAASVVPVWLARTKQGGGENQWVGLMWALCLLAAVAHREMLRTRRGMRAATVIYSLVAASAFVGGAYEPHRWEQRLSPEVLEYAADHSIYLPEIGTVSGEAWPGRRNIVDLLAAGEEPDYLADALACRHFDAVAPIAVTAERETYISASGLSSASRLAELNRLMAEGYSAGANGTPTGLWGRVGESSC